MLNLDMLIKTTKYYDSIPDPIKERSEPPIKYDKAHEFFLPKYLMLTIMDTTNIAGSPPNDDIVKVHRSS